MLDNQIQASGIDFSEKLVQVCRKKDLDVRYGDTLAIPYPDNTFDNIISIAVVHHLKEEEDRIEAIEEMIRVCKPGGKILISMWSVEQTGNELQNRSFTYGDNQVKWKDTTRYYFVYDEPHIQEFILQFIYKYYVKLTWERGNWYIEIIV
jgi:ubiquinone/menaquinone biosynthesis C-methylase UbiE